MSVADPAPLALARWSSCAARSLRSPPLERSADYLRWLERIGRETPGLALIPTSDDLVWILATSAGTLREHFRLAPLTPEGALQVLDKWTLREACLRAGVGTLPTWLPRREADLEDIAREAGFPLVVKPRTQLFHRTHSKGVVVEDFVGLLAAFRRLAAEGCEDPALLARVPGLALPLIQAFASGAEAGVISIAGFADAQHEILAARASRKRVLYPRSLSVGVRFAAIPLERQLLDSLGRLFAVVGFHGIFEAEFVPWQGGLALIDFNPRVYGQIGFDMARGLPLAELAYREAIGGDEAGLLRLASSPGRDLPEAEYVNSFAVAADRFVSRLLGESSPVPEVAVRRENALEFVLDAHDRLPMLVDGAQILAGQLRRLVKALAGRGRRHGGARRTPPIQPD